MVFLIGCDHDKAQTYSASSKLDDPQNSKQWEFRELLNKVINAHHPVLIAEEFHPEFLKRRSLRSVVFDVASSAGIAHRFCDPSLVERDRLGISDGPPFAPPGWNNHEAMYKYFLRDWPIREEFWITQLDGDIHKNVLFVFGAGHRETLRRRLRRRAVEVKILEKRFGTSTNIWDSDFPAYRAAYKELRRNDFPTVS